MIISLDFSIGTLSGSTMGSLRKTVIIACVRNATVEPIEVIFNTSMVEPFSIPEPT
mgnify:CR=1 FL=1